MTRDATSVRGEIEELVDVLGADIQALRRSGAINQTMVEELREIVEEIETCVGAVADR